MGNALTSSLASRVTSKYAHQVIIKDGDKIKLNALASNPSISDEIWWKLAKLKSVVALKCNLIKTKRILSEEQILHLFKDKRDTVRREIFSSALGGISGDFAKYILDTYIVADSGRHEYLFWWLHSEIKIPDSILPTLVKLQGGQLALKIASKNLDLFTIEDMIGLTSDDNVSSFVTTELWNIIDLLPELSKALIGSKSEYVVEALAGSRHIFGVSDFTKIIDTIRSADRVIYYQDALFSLLANPNLPINLRPEVRELIKKTGFPRLRYSVRFTTVMDNSLILKEYDDLVELDLSTGTSTAIFVDTPWQDLDVTQIAALRTSYHKRLIIPIHYRSVEWVKYEPRKLSPKSEKAVQKAITYDLSEILVGHHHNISLITKEQLAKEIQEPIDSIGLEGWQVFLDLANDWQLSISELVETALSMAYHN